MTSFLWFSLQMRDLIFFWIEVEFISDSMNSILHPTFQVSLDLD